MSPVKISERDANHRDREGKQTKRKIRKGVKRGAYPLKTHKMLRSLGAHLHHYTESSNKSGNMEQSVTWPRGRLLA